MSIDISVSFLLCFILLFSSLLKTDGVTLSEVCADVLDLDDADDDYQQKDHLAPNDSEGGGSGVILLGRSYSKNVKTALEYFCNFADSPHSTNVEACESFVDTRFAQDDQTTVILRGESSTLAVLKSYCSIHKNVLTRHICTFQGVKELAGWVQIDMSQYAEMGGCYGLDDASILLHFDEPTGLIDHYQFIAEHEKLYTCIMEKAAQAAKEKEQDLSSATTTN